MNWIGMITTLGGLYLNGRKIWWCWPIWIISNIAWIVAFLRPFDLAGILCNACLLVLNIVGWRNWARKVA